MTIRIGCIPYLNTRPLISALLDERQAAAPPGAAYRIVFETPARLAELLAAGEVDVGLLPSVEYYRGEDLRLLPDISIAGQGPAESVRLFLRRPLTELARVGLDPASRTSAALLRVILAERRRGATIEYVATLPETDPAADASLDAWLIIGDPGLRYAPPAGVAALDLGQAWWELSRLPFVFAVWAVRAKADLGEVATKLRLAKYASRSSLADLARREAARLALPYPQVFHYLRDVMRYDLSPAELGGLTAFYRYCVKWSLAPEGGQVRFYGER